VPGGISNSGTEFDCETHFCWSTWSGRGHTVRRNLKLDESCISNPKAEISNWTVQFRISDLGFEMQDSSNFKFSSRGISTVYFLLFTFVIFGLMAMATDF